MQGKLILAGGGSEKDSRRVDESFASGVAAHQKILYLPLALRGIQPYNECLRWMKATYLPLNLTNIEMWTDLSEHQSNELGEFAAIYIGGGNTYALLAQIIESGFHHHLTEYVSQGGMIYGGSAGAVILGKNIRTVAHIDRNDIGLIETNGLDLVDNHAIWVHYQPQDDDLIAEFQENAHHSVLAISERAGIMFDHSGLISVGFDPAYRFDRQGKHCLQNT